MSLVRESDAPLRREWFSARLLMVVVGSVAMIWVATVVVGGWKASHQRAEAPRAFAATGTAKRHVDPEGIEWAMTISAHAMDRAAAIRELRASVEAARAYLSNHAVNAAEITLDPVSVEDDTKTITHHHADGTEDTEDVPNGFLATQEITVRSADIARVLRAYRVATSAAELSAAEVAEPSCTLSESDDIRKELTATARREMRATAEADVAAIGGARLGKLVSADTQGYAVEGAGTLTACERGADAVAVVRATYQLD